MSLLIALHLLTPGAVASTTCDERNVERVELSLQDGSKHSAVLSVPQRPREKLPVIIVLGGFETGERSLDFLPENVEAIYAVIDYPYKAPGERGFIRDLREISVIKRAVHRTDFAIDALMERLRQDRRVDVKRMIIVGASFGAPFAITAAVRHRELTGLVLIHAFGRVDAAIEQQLVNEWGRWSKPFAWAIGRLAWNHLAYNKPELEMLKLHPSQRGLLVYSYQDEQLPSESVSAILEAVKKSPAHFTVVESRGGHLGPGKKEALNEALTISLRWLGTNFQIPRLKSASPAPSCG